MVIRYLARWETLGPAHVFVDLQPVSICGYAARRECDRRAANDRPTCKHCKRELKKLASKGAA